MSSSLFRRQQRSSIVDFLMAHADALINRSLDTEKLLEQYNEVAASQVDSLVSLAEQISVSLVPVQPSEEFVTELRQRLSDAVFLEPASWWQRIRQLPPSVQLAAGISGATLAAGVVLVARRPVLEAVSDYWRNRHTIIA